MTRHRREEKKKKEQGDTIVQGLQGVTDAASEVELRAQNWSWRKNTKYKYYSKKQGEEVLTSGDQGHKDGDGDDVERNIFYEDSTALFPHFDVVNGCPNLLRRTEPDWWKKR